MMRTRVSSLTNLLPASARETVDVDTPASRAMSAICKRRWWAALSASGGGVFGMADVKPMARCL